MKTLTSLLVVTLLSFTFDPLSAQEEVSKEDVQAVTRELQSVQSEIRKQRKTVAAEIEKTRKAQEALSTRLAKENAAREAKALATAQAESARQIAEQKKTQNMMIYGGGAGLLVLSIALALLVRGRKTVGDVAASHTKKVGILENPDIPTLKKWSEENGGITTVPFVRILVEGQRFNCVATLREGDHPLVTIEGGTPVTWQKHKQACESIMRRKQMGVAS